MLKKEEEVNFLNDFGKCFYLDAANKNELYQRMSRQIGHFESYRVHTIESLVVDR